uniref:Uncharacterized protein n=1 Tax=Romanomermis culicivorax TaxID=13658 RepID=A0A915JC93_ROMCU
MIDVVIGVLTIVALPKIRKSISIILKRLKRVIIKDSVSNEQIKAKHGTNKEKEIDLYAWYRRKRPNSGSVTINDGFQYRDDGYQQNIQIRGHAKATIDGEMRQTLINIGEPIKENKTMHGMAKNTKGTLESKLG